LAGLVPAIYAHPSGKILVERRGYAGHALPDAHISTSAPLRDGLFYESMWLR
jgi:hypothetical protein